MKEAVYKTYENRCFRCRMPVVEENREVDHIIPWSKGGPTELANLQLLCRSSANVGVATRAGRIGGESLRRRDWRVGIFPSAYGQCGETSHVRLTEEAGHLSRLLQYSSKTQEES